MVTFEDPARAPSRLALPDPPVVIDSEPRRLERIVGNLLDNAREHATGARVDVTVESDDDSVVVAVADTGHGVPDDRIERIFERFYKADPSRHEGSSGLGLAIAAEHAALLGGELRAANREGGGLSIELRLPVTRSFHGGDVTAISADDDGGPSSTQEPAP